MEGNNNRTVGNPDTKSAHHNSNHHAVDTSLEMVEKDASSGDYRSSSLKAPSHAKRIPVLFERARFGVFNPSFDSRLLERHLDQEIFPHTRWRFLLVLVYVLISSLCWMIYFGLAKPGPHWAAHIGVCVALFTVSIVFIIFAFLQFFKRHYYLISFIYALFVSIFTLLRFVTNPEDMSMSRFASFTSAMEIILLNYYYVPLPLYGAAGLSLVYSIIYEALALWHRPMKESTVTIPYIIGTTLLHLCVHLICILLHLISSVRRHSLFNEISKATLAKKQLREEAKLKEDMIHSLMPPNVAKEAMQHRNNDDDPDTNVKGGEIVFRQFTMDRMSNVSILFADIVGFTKMSSNKTAETLVGLLNDLFGRFDKLCAENGCEKISTLGDCYYCVSGCPKADEEHANNCIKLGLDMVRAIKEFDEDHNEEVNMRVGIHTGTILCGIVGTRRFKFDVWSHDVDLANVMESTGKPGRVHISEATYSYIKDLYEVEPGEIVQDTRIVRNLTEQYDHTTAKFGVQQIEVSGVTKTYFIVEPKNDSDSESLKTERVFNENNANSTNISPEPPLNSKDEEVVDLIVNDKDEDMLEDNKAVSGFLNMRTQSQDDLALKRKGSLMMKTDALLLEELKTDMEMNRNFRNVRLNTITQNFKNCKYEEKYRKHISADFLHSTETKTLALPRYNIFLDVLVNAIVTLLLIISMIAGFDITVENNTIWLAVSVVFGCLVILHLLGLSFTICRTSSYNDDEKVSDRPSKCSRIFACIYGWYASHVIGFLQLIAPLAVVFTAYNCDTLSTPTKQDFFMMASVTAIVHSISFSLLSNLLKLVVAVLGAVVVLVLYHVPICTSPPDDREISKYESILVIVLLVLLLSSYNRDIDHMTRLEYNGTMEAEKNKKKAEKEKMQAEWLLHDIIPAHVMDQIKLKSMSCYSQSHKDVGVIFISIVNFDEFYDESFQGGKEFLRVLNELFMDYEALFNKKKYKDIEKIKTIGATFMAASGLDQTSREKNANKYDHLYALMDFCCAIRKVVKRFNRGMFNFQFKLKIGYNVGDIVSGVIGTSKLHFDIWGNTVNVSSRMYSTGLADAIQVTEETAKLLEDRYIFVYRDTIEVKGKGMMRTYLLVKKREIPGDSPNSDLDDSDGSENEL